MLLISSFSLSAQVILPAPETAFEPAHNFNPEVIRTKGVRRITFEILDKKDFEVAVDKNLVENYEFNEAGNLTRYYYTVIVRSVEKQVTSVNRRGRPVTSSNTEYVYDTVSTSYFYREGKLALKRYHDGLNYYESRYYHYDKDGNLTKELRYRETNVSPNKSYFVLGNQVLLSEDSFQYHKFPSGQLKTIFLNNENRPYKERITNYDMQGNIRDMTESYTSASWIVQEHKFEYVDGRMTLATFEGNASTPVQLRNTYEYDENKELYTEKQYRNGVLQKELSYVTLKSDTLLNSLVIRDHINKNMRIIKLKYDRNMLSKGQ